jgi:hypothetical protein
LKCQNVNPNFNFSEDLKSEIELDDEEVRQCKPKIKNSLSCDAAWSDTPKPRDIQKEQKLRMASGDMLFSLAKRNLFPKCDFVYVVQDDKKNNLSVHRLGNVHY